MIFPDGDDRKTRERLSDSLVEPVGIDACWAEIAKHRGRKLAEVEAERDAVIREREEMRLRVWRYEAGPEAAVIAAARTAVAGGASLSHHPDSAYGRLTAAVQALPPAAPEADGGYDTTLAALWPPTTTHAVWRAPTGTTRLAVWRAPSGATWIDVAGSPSAERMKGDPSWTFVGWLDAAG